jgi:hypothetical protein
MLRPPFATVLFGLVAAGCAGDGCLQPIPDGFPPEQRMPGAIQVRVTETGLAALEDNIGAVVGALVPDGLNFEVPDVCGDNPEVCCGGGPGTCVVEVDLAPRPGDPPRLVLEPGPAADSVGVTVRARARTLGSGLEVDYETFLTTADCEVTLDTTRDGADSLTVTADLRLTQDPTTGTTRAQFANVGVGDLDSDDIDIDGDLLCDLADFFRGFFIDQIRDQLQQQAGQAVSDQLCKRCVGDAECAPFGACVAGMCEIDDGAGRRCLQELGLAGRVLTSELLPAVSPYPAIDLHLIAGGFVDTPAAGLNLGILAGARPVDATGAPPCGPPADAPVAPASIPPIALLGQNAAPELGAFDVGLGVHRSFLDRTAWSIYQSGGMCAQVDHTTADVLTTETFGTVLP